MKWNLATLEKGECSNPCLNPSLPGNAFVVKLIEVESYSFVGFLLNREVEPHRGNVQRHCVTSLDILSCSVVRVVPTLIRDFFRFVAIEQNELNIPRMD